MVFSFGSASCLHLKTIILIDDISSLGKIKTRRIFLNTFQLVLKVKGETSEQKNIIPIITITIILLPLPGSRSKICVCIYLYLRVCIYIYM